MNQLVKFGLDSVDYLNVFLAEYSPKNILLVTGKKSYINCGAQKKIEPILYGYNFIRFSDFKENPIIEDVEKGVEIFNKNKCDLIIAIGGGSVIDMAKLIKFFSHKQKPFIKYFNSGLEKDNDIPLAVLPTTAGAGSEATHFAVVYVDQIKYSISSEYLLPNVVCIDSSFLHSQSKYQITVSGLDALSQSIESYWCINSNVESMKFSKKAIKLIWDNLTNSVNKNVESLEKLSKGAYYAGRAINLTKTTGPHALSYGFTIKYGLPHGHSVALFLPFFIGFHNETLKVNCNDNRGEEFVRNQISNIEKIININKNTLEKEVLKMFKRLNIEINFEKLKIDFTGFSVALKGINQDRLKNNPRTISLKEVESIYFYNLKI